MLSCNLLVGDYFLAPTYALYCDIATPGLVKLDCVTDTVFFFNWRSLQQKQVKKATFFFIFCGLSCNLSLVFLLTESKPGDFEARFPITSWGGGGKMTAVTELLGEDKNRRRPIESYRWEKVDTAFAGDLKPGQRFSDAGSAAFVDQTRLPLSWSVLWRPGGLCALLGLTTVRRPIQKNCNL